MHAHECSQVLGQVGVVELLVDTIRVERMEEMALWAGAGNAALGGPGGGSAFPGGFTAADSAARGTPGRSGPSAEGLARSGLVPLGAAAAAAASGPAGAASTAANGHRTHLHGHHALPGAPPPQLQQQRQQLLQQQKAPFGVRVSAWDRLMAALLLREVLAPLMAPGLAAGAAAATPVARGTTAEAAWAGAAADARAAGACLLSPGALALYGLLLPLLTDEHTSTVHRLCVVKEAVVAVKALVRAVHALPAPAAAVQEDSRLSGGVGVACGAWVVWRRCATTSRTRTGRWRPAPCPCSCT